MTEKTTTGTKTIQEILKEKNLSIPNYQRPYKWSEKHIHQLLDDLYFHFDKDRDYQLGTIIIHNNENSLKIVDGQQRLISLSLLFYALKPDKELPLLKQGRDNLNAENKQQIINNYQLITSFINLRLADKVKKQAFLEKIENYKMGYIEITDLDEAFQLFDSQNSRGKPLEAYDLLKAYHLREKFDNEKNKLQYVKKWEEAADATEANLKQVIGDMLYPLRKWYKNEKYLHYFSRQHIDMFKGAKPEQNDPYLLAIYASRAIHQIQAQFHYLVDKKFSQSYFSVNQPIINGELFFEYVIHYIEVYHFLFNQEKGYLSKDFYLLKNLKNSEKYKKENYKSLFDFIHSYNGSHRTGDGYIRELFKCLIFRYYDKFGYNKLDEAVNLCFRWCYKLRLENGTLFYNIIEDKLLYPNKNSLLRYLENASSAEEFLRYPITKINKVERNDLDYLENIINGEL
ncbi:DUF262 domain-containing protein [Volucribacter amazonae]|uniref:DUF262 domain-containing protein n=1 Tax=Volucribacter amazonae TaxID=256731 RepID=A0A9X4PLX2_9PAST|nr:DUF262 domain-containing protein [Volucribacter amazonae]MDG6894203.1 hypothetical protein [Volucribacter amazonae]